MWFKKRFKRKVIDVINELKEIRDAKQKVINSKIDRSEIYVLNSDNIVNIQAVVKVMQLLDKGGITFKLTGDDIREYKNIVKRKYD